MIVLFLTVVYICLDKGQHQAFSSLALYLVFWVRVSHWNLGLLIQLNWLDWLAASPEIPCSPSSPSLGLQRCAVLPDFLSGCWGSELRSSRLHSKHFIHQAISKVIIFIFLRKSHIVSHYSTNDLHSCPTILKGSLWLHLHKHILFLSCWLLG